MFELLIRGLGLDDTNGVVTLKGVVEPSDEIKIRCDGYYYL